MITTPEASIRRRPLRIAIVASVVVHVVLVVLALLANLGWQRLLGPSVVARPRPVDEVVTISSALRIEKRPRPAVAARAARRPTPVAPRPRVALAPPRPRAVLAPPRASVVRPTYAPPVRLRHEIATSAVRAPPAAARSTKATATARPFATPAAAVVASRGAATRAAAERADPATSRASGTLSQQRLDEIERDLARTIAQARANVDPIRTVPHERPASPKHYRVQMEGRFSSLRRGEGTYSPIKAWKASGLDYYYVSYEFVYADGTYESGSVPWPIHFTPGADPFARDDPSLVGRTPLPAPPPDYMPPGTLGKALRTYFPNLRFSDRD
ncbi:MAG: hypothetical protein NVS3B17_14870 [Vulcanimicrobiaceae bacterium]